MTFAKCPVFVVGGRTTGLMMAAELARHGIPVRIVDKSPGIDGHSRATLIHSRTLEIFDSLGIADRVKELGQPMRRFLLFADGKLVGQTNMAAVESPFPHGIALSQAKTEAVLARHLNSLGVHVERNTELTAMEQTETGIRATLNLADGNQELLETRWLIGCDGAHSTVRHILGEHFPGEADPVPYLLADVVVDGPRNPDDVHMYLHDEGELYFFILDEGRCLVVASGEKGNSRRDAPTLEFMQHLVDRRTTGGFRLSDPRWLTCFHIHYRLVPHYRQGRVFLAGDAAHVHSLIGGHGMNTGIQDAHNLAWKLALVERGILPEPLLDTYETERRNVAQDVIAATKLATEKGEVYAELSPRDRKNLCDHMFVPESETWNARHHDEELDLDYSSSPICLEPEGDFQNGPHAGSRAIDVTPLFVENTECTLFRLLANPRHKLLLFCGLSDGTNHAELLTIAQTTEAKYNPWMDVFLVSRPQVSVPIPSGVTLIKDPQHKLHEMYGASKSCFYLIRPDGYVAFRSSQLNSVDPYLTSRLKVGYTQ